MANEISITTRLYAIKNGAIVDASGTYAASMSGSDLLQGTQLVGTSAELLDLGEITLAPKIRVANLDSTNFVNLSTISNGSSPLIKLSAGEAALFPSATVQIYAIADTTPCRVHVSAAA